MGAGVGADIPVDDRIIGRLLQLAAGKGPGPIAAERQGHQHRVIGGLAFARIHSKDSTHIQQIDHLHHEVRQVLFREMVLNTRGQQVRGVAVDWKKTGV